MKLTADGIANLKLPEAGAKQALYFDDDQKGFGIRVTAGGSRAFIFDSKIHGKTRRITIGRCNELSIVSARKKAKSLAGQIAMGGDPVAEARADKIRAKTLAEAIEDYFAARTELKPGTIKDQRTAMRQMTKLLGKPVNAITEDDIKEHHTRRGERSKARANLEIRYLRAWLNFASAAYKVEGQRILTANPARVIAEERRTYRVNRKRTRVQTHQMPAWLNALDSLGGDWAEYFKLLIATGLRRQEALDLKWSDIDLKGGTLVVRDPKNHQPHELPLPTRTWTVLRLRKDRYDARPKAGQVGYVFSDDRGVRLVEPRMAVEKIKALSGVPHCNPHDLRRTFASVAEELDTGKYTLKRLMNHADGADVTSAYVTVSMDKLRRTIQEIEDAIYAAD